MKYFSLFTGIGGFELGIQQAYETIIKSKQLRKKGLCSKGHSNSIKSRVRKQQYTCVGYSEIDKYAIQIFEKHYPKIKNYGDCTKINVSELPNFDMLIGGFPCQSFSIAGKRGGFKDTRGTLFFEIARIAKAKRPRLLFLENVKGLLSHNEGNTFATIISTLDELGYDCQWQVLNSKNFGVPQNRERVFIIGHLRGTSRPKVFPIEESNENFNEGNKKGKNQTADTITRGYSKRNARGTHILKEITNAVNNPLKGKTKYGWHFEQNVFDDKGISRAIKAGEGSGNKLKILKDTKIRRLTPTECERLQGFPDGWTKYGALETRWDFDKKIEVPHMITKISDTQRYKTLGNAVTVNVIKEIAKRLL